MKYLRNPQRGQAAAHRSAKSKQPPRERYPNLSPTRPPAVEADAALWDAIASVPVELLNLDMFDDDGRPLFARRGV